MATIIQRGKVFRAIIRRKGAAPITKSCPTRKEAKDWAELMERDLEERAKFGCPHTLDQLIIKHIADVIAPKKYDTHCAQSAARRLAKVVKGVSMDKMLPTWWVKTARDFRVSPTSTLRYLSVIVAALKTGEAFYEVKPDWDSYRVAMLQLSKLGLVGAGAARDRRPQPGELERIKAAVSSAMPILDIIDFAVITGMRVDEICSIRWADLSGLPDAPMILVRDRKHPTKKIGNTFNVPLLGNAYAIIKRQRKTIGPEGQEPRIFPFVADSVGSAFARAVTAAKVPNFHFHDLRHEAVSSLFEAGYAIPEVALVSGHRSWGSLKRYANLKPEGLHSGPVAHQGAKLRKAAA